MKRNALILTFAMLASLLAGAGASPFAAPLRAQEPCLIPTPRHITLTGGRVNMDSLKGFKAVRRDSLPVAENMEQAYRITVDKRQATIEYCGDEGYANALCTYYQLQENNRLRGSIPCLAVLDYPAFTYRGWLDDISRGPMPTRDFIAREADVLSSCKMNFANLYTEHTLYNDKHVDVPPADGIRKGDIAYPFSRMANLQVFAHAEKTLRIPFYQGMMDTKRNLNPGAEETYDFLADMLARATEVYDKAEFFNIDCDETEGLGTGHAKSYVQGVGGSEEAYVRHINRVHDMLKPQGLRMLMWGDIVAKKTAMIKRLPDDMEYICWNYAPQESYSADLAPFLEALEGDGGRLWVAPSTAHHGKALPNPATYMPNIAYMARDGHRAGACGLMSTSWDDGGEELFDNNWHAMLWAAEMAWNPLESIDPAAARNELKAREEAFNKAFDMLFAGQQGTAAMLYKAGALESDPDVAGWMDIAALNEPLCQFHPTLVDSAMGARAERALQKIGRLEVELETLSAGQASKEQASANNAGTPANRALAHVRYALHRVAATAHKCELRRAVFLRLKKESATDDEQVKLLAKAYLRELHALKKEYLRLWDYESREYSRQIACDRYDRLGFEALELDRHVFVQASGDSVALRTLYGDRPIFYTLDGRKPTQGSTPYEKPFPIAQSCLLQAVAFNEYGEGVFASQYLLHHKALGCPIALGSAYSTYRDTYSGGGNGALTDGLLGSDESYGDGHWQGYWGADLDASIDLRRKTEVRQISIRFLQNAFDWILAPKEIRVYVSDDGKAWRLVRTERYDPEFAQSGNVVHTDAVRNLSLTTRYLRVVAPNPGTLPEWHPARGQMSYIFADEIVVE